MGAKSRVVAGAGVAGLVLTVLVAATLVGHGGDPAEIGGEKRPMATGDGSTVEAPSTPSRSIMPTWAGPHPPPSDPALRLGSDSAPVTIVEFGDFQCPNCGRYARDIAPALKREYVDTGVVRIYWRDFPAFGRESERAAIAARAAAKQGRFWAFHDAFYARQPPRGRGRINDGFLHGLAQKVGLDVARFDADRRDRTVRSAMEADFAFGQRLGVPGTPAFLIDGEPFFGAQPLAKFEQAIEKARAAP